MGRRSRLGSGLIKLSERSALCRGRGGGGVNRLTSQPLPQRVRQRASVPGRQLGRARTWAEQQRQAHSGREGAEAAGRSRTCLCLCAPGLPGAPWDGSFPCRWEAQSPDALGSELWQVQGLGGEGIAGLLGPSPVPQLLPQGDREHLDKGGGRWEEGQWQQV